MECQVRLHWCKDDRSSSYQSFRIRLLDIVNGEVDMVCESKAAADVRVTLKKGSLRRLVKDHVNQGRATVFFSDEEASLASVDIKNASPYLLESFISRLNTFLSSSSAKMKICTARRHSYGARMLEASLANTTPNRGKFYNKSPMATAPYTSPRQHSWSSPRSSTPTKRPSTCPPYSTTPTSTFTSSSHYSPSSQHYQYSPRRPSVKRPLQLDSTQFQSHPPKRLPLKDLNSKENVPATNSTTKRSHGFANLGNTCYMNSVLQSLLGLHPFAADLVSSDVGQKVPPNSLYQMLYLLAKSRYASDSLTAQHILLKKIRQAISSSASKFAGFNEQDAHELLSHCLDQLKSDVLSLPATQDKRLCAVESNFKSAIQKTITCNKCKNKVSTTETVFDYTLQLPPWAAMNSSQEAGLQQLLEDYFTTEEVEYTCSLCKGKSSSLSHQLVQLPRVLILTLKRYDVFTSGKRVDPVRIPRFLVLGSLCSAMVHTPQHPKTVVEPPPVQQPLTTHMDPDEQALNIAIQTSMSSTRKDLQIVGLSEEEQLRMALDLSIKESTKEDEADVQIEEQGRSSPEPSAVHTYRLVSIISHVGKGSSTGHYVSDVFSNVSDGSWYSYNDSVVTPTTEATVRQSRKKSGYIFFYLHKNLLQRDIR